MANINELLARAAALRDETALNSISPERAGGIMYDTLLAMNELWLQQGAALVISKIYASVAAMEADTAPVSDLTGQPLRPGQIVVIASSDSDNGSVYRYNGTSSPSWSLVGNIGSQYVSVSQNTLTGGYDLNIGSDSTNIASQEESEVQSQYSTLNLGKLPMKNCGFIYDYAGGHGVAKYISGGNKGFLMYLPPNVTEIIHDVVGIFAIERFDTFPQVGDMSVERVTARYNIFNSTKELVKLSSNTNGAWLLATSPASDSYDDKYIYACNNAADIDLVNYALYADYVTPKRAGLMYAGGAVKGSNASYDSFIIPIVKDVTDVFVKNGTSMYISYKWFASKPTYGDAGTSVSVEATGDDAILKNVKKGYILATYNKSNVDVDDIQISTIRYTKEENPYIKQFQSTDYSGIYYRGSDGSIQPADSGHNSFVFSMKKGARYIVTGTIIGVVIYNGNPLGSEYTHVASNPSFPYLCQYDNYYMMIIVDPSTYQDDLYIASSGNLSQDLAGKNIVCFGDSLTEFGGSELFGQSYPNYLSIMANAKVVNGGIGGSRYAQHVTPQTVPTSLEEAYSALSVSNLVKHWAENDWTMIDNAVDYLRTQASDDNRTQIDNLKAMPIANVDIVVLMAGANDFTLATIPIGTPGEVNTSTIVGGLGYAINAILSVNPDVAIYVVTEPVRWFGDRTEPSNFSDIYELGGRSYVDMMAAIYDSAKSFHLPCFDLYWELGWNKLNFSEYFDSDNTHPIKGYSVIARRIYDGINAHLNKRLY